MLVSLSWVSQFTDWYDTYVVMLSVIMLSVIMLSVFKLNVVAPIVTLIIPKNVL